MRNNFNSQEFISLVSESFQKWGLLLEGLDNLSRKTTLSKLILLPSGKEVLILKGKKLLPWSKAFLFRKVPFHKGLSGHKMNTEVVSLVQNVTQIVSLVQNGRKTTRGTFSP